MLKPGVTSFYLISCLEVKEIPNLELLSEVF